MVAAVLWGIGMFSITGLSAYGAIAQSGVGYAGTTSSPSFLLTVLLVPLVSMFLAVAEFVFLFPWLSQDHALLIGRILFLLIVPAFILLTRHSGLSGEFPLGIQWLGYPLLWFRIRENFK